MTVVCGLEQRQAQRSTVQWPVSVWHPDAGRFFNGCSVNVSSVGALVILPIKTPVQEGQSLELNFPRSHELAQNKGSCARIKPARVIRVDRSNTVASAAIKVAVEFSEHDAMTI